MVSSLKRLCGKYATGIAKRQIKVNMTKGIFTNHEYISQNKNPHTHSTPQCVPSV